MVKKWLSLLQVSLIRGVCSLYFPVNTIHYTKYSAPHSALSLSLPSHFILFITATVHAEQNTILLTLRKLPIRSLTQAKTQTLSG